VANLLISVRSLCNGKATKIPVNIQLVPPFQNPLIESVSQPIDTIPYLLEEIVYRPGTRKYGRLFNSQVVQPVARIFLASCLMECPTLNKEHKRKLAQFIAQRLAIIEVTM
jgi:hypothetical protein